MKVSIEKQTRRHPWNNYTPKVANQSLLRFIWYLPAHKARHNVDKIQDTFFGSFANNKPHGEVLVHYCDGSKHQGTFRDGTRHGRGTTEEENGNRVVGTWALDKRDGIFEVGASWPGYRQDLAFRFSLGRMGSVGLWLALPPTSCAHVF